MSNYELSNEAKTIMDRQNIKDEMMEVLKRKLESLRYQLHVAESNKSHFSAIELKAQIFIVETLWGDLIRIEV